MRPSILEEGARRCRSQLGRSPKLHGGKSWDDSSLTNRNDRNAHRASVVVFCLGVGAALFILAANPDSLAAVIASVATCVLSALAMLGIERVHDLRRPPAVLYVFQRGLVLKDGDGRTYAYTWSQVRTRTHRTQDLGPWSAGQTFLDLNGDDDRHLGTLAGVDTRNTIQALMSGDAGPP